MMRRSLGIDLTAWRSYHLRILVAFDLRLCNVDVVHVASHALIDCFVWAWLLLNVVLLVTQS